MDPTEKIEWKCIGFPSYKILEEIYKEKEINKQFGLKIRCVWL
ncbi:hypothetical protein ACX16C_24305 [Bacillus cereus]